MFPPGDGVPPSWLWPGAPPRTARAPCNDIFPPAAPKLPPAYKLVPHVASALTSAPPPLSGLVPEPRADHPFPSHRAMRLADTPSAIVKIPPAYNVSPATATVSTVLFIPAPTADHELPSQRAT